MITHPIPDAALANHTGVVGKTGSGKSYAAKGVIERLLARGERVAIVDPTGVYWGLRLAPDGRTASAFAPVIFGGRHADLPLAADAGARLAAIIGGSTTPVILDTQLMSVGERTRMFTAFAEALLRENQGPLTLVLDEAHLFAPQGGAAAGGFETAKLLHATNNLVALGRSAGLRILLITQRPAKLHKDALTQVETLVALRVTSPQDRKAVALWLEGAPELARSADIIGTLASLKTGEGWVYAPEQGVLERATFPAIATFDSGRPLAAGAMPALEPIDIVALREALAFVHDETPDRHIQDPSRTVGEAQAEGRTLAVPRRPERLQTTTEAATKRVEIEAAEQRGYERGIKAAAAHIRHFALSWHAPAGGRSIVLEQADKHPVGEVFADAILEMIGEHDGPLASQPCIADAPRGRVWEKPAVERRPDRSAAEPEASIAHAAPALVPAQSRPPAAPTRVQSRDEPALTAASANLSPTARRILAVLRGMHPASLTFRAAALRAARVAALVAVPVLRARDPGVGTDRRGLRPAQGARRRRPYSGRSRPRRGLCREAAALMGGDAPRDRG